MRRCNWLYFFWEPNSYLEKNSYSPNWCLMPRHWLQGQGSIHAVVDRIHQGTLRSSLETQWARILAGKSLLFNPYLHRLYLPGDLWLSLKIMCDLYITLIALLFISKVTQERWTEIAREKFHFGCLKKNDEVSWEVSRRYWSLRSVRVKQSTTPYLIPTHTVFIPFP